jgi:TonB family protein
VQVASNAPVARPAGAAPATTAVEILFKPRPAYTAEARRLQIEGEVVFEIQFSASGEVRIVRVVQGLGHGLDESASDAARQIRFRPALRALAPVDSTAIVHIQFQLAY